MRIRHSADHFGQIIDRYAPAIARVENARGGGSCRQESVRCCDIFHVHEIARLLAIAMNRDRFMLQGALDKNRHSGGILAFRILARTKDVEIAEAGRLQSTFVSKYFAIVFTVELGDGVRTFWLGEHGFNFGRLRIVAVNCRGTAEDELLYFGPGSFFANDEGAS